jgi:hypothetical protein
MHSIKNISERNKIDTQSRADAYIKRKTKKNTKNTKKHKKTHWAGLKKTVFFQPCHKVNLSIGEKGLPVLEVASRSRDQDNDDEEGESSCVEQVTTTKNCSV